LEIKQWRVCYKAGMEENHQHQEIHRESKTELHMKWALKCTDKG